VSAAYAADGRSDMMAQDAGQANGRDEIVAYCKKVTF